MLEKPPPDGKRVTALSSSFLTLPVSTVAPTVVRYGHVAGKSGEKTLPLFRQPLSLPSPAGPATPESPEATRTETPWRPSFMNSLHWRCW